MTTTRTIRTILAGAIAAGALFAALPGATAHAGTFDRPMTWDNVKNAPLQLATGDFDSDGDVDGRDFLIWQRGASSADFDNDGDVDGRDFLTWQRNPSVAESGDYNQWRTNFGVGASSDSSNTTQHELGHVLGFRHEHTRPTTAGEDSDGNDFLDGQQGDDSVRMGAGNDVFQWDPGDGSDTVESQAPVGGLADWQSNYGVGS